MIKEEFDFKDIDDFLYNDVDYLFAGIQGEEERSSFFFNNWNDRKKSIINIYFVNEIQVRIICYKNQKCISEKTIDYLIELPRILSEYGINGKNILMDISSLDHVLIMCLTRIFITDLHPKKFFAVYIRPEQYCNQSGGSIDSSLCEKFMGVKAIPGFVRREQSDQKLCSFIGFEGRRLTGILEVVHDVEIMYSVIAFPSGSPHWYRVTIWNSMDILKTESPEFVLYKCLSESVFGAIDLLNKLFHKEDNVVLVPLGTRPHSLACAIYCCDHQNAGIIYDYAIEKKKRTVGISDIKVYHLSSFVHS
jgi:hypothetical protein